MFLNEAVILHPTPVPKQSTLTQVLRNLQRTGALAVDPFLTHGGILRFVFLQKGAVGESGVKAENIQDYIEVDGYRVTNLFYCPASILPFQAVQQHHLDGSSILPEHSVSSLLLLKAKSKQICQSSSTYCGSHQYDSMHNLAERIQQVRLHAPLSIYFHNTSFVSPFIQSLMCTTPMQNHFTCHPDLHMHCNHIDFFSPHSGWWVTAGTEGLRMHGGRATTWFTRVSEI